MLISALPKCGLVRKLILFVFAFHFFLPVYAGDEGLKNSAVFISLLVTENGQEREIPAGTGFIIHPSGYILTNTHVIRRPGAKIKGRWKDRYGGASFNIHLVEKHKNQDIALLKLESGKNDFPYLALDTAFQPVIGKNITAWGFPGDEDGTLLRGWISALTGASAGWAARIDTSHGMSGSPVVTEQNKVIGIARREDGDAKLADIIPINYAVTLIKDNVPGWPPSRRTDIDWLPPRKYALLIGLNDYGGFDRAEQQVPDLKFAETDVDKLEAVFSRLGFDVQTFKSGTATRRAIVGKLNYFARIVGEEDEFLLYFAGHGIRNGFNREIYWLTYDIDLNHPDVRGIRLRHLLDYVKDIKAKKKIVILDHCYSGTLVLASGKSAASGRTLLIARARGMKLEKDDFDPAAFRNRISNDGSMWPNTYVVAAARGNAYEIDKYEGKSVKAGLLTHVVIQALTKNNASSDLNLSFQEFKRYVKREVKKISKIGQEPDLPTPIDINISAPIFFLRDAKIQAPNYRDKIVRWAAKGLIEKRVEDRVKQYLKLWQDFESQGQELDEETKRFIDGVIHLFELDKSLTDETRAKRMIRLLEILDNL